MTTPDTADIRVSTTCFSPATFNAGGPGTLVIFQAAGSAPVTFSADAGLFYVEGKSGPVNTSGTQFLAPVAPATLPVYVAAGASGPYMLRFDRDCDDGQKVSSCIHPDNNGDGEINVGSGPGLKSSSLPLRISS
jgi:hypothetical protein